MSACRLPAPPPRASPCPLLLSGTLANDNILQLIQSNCICWAANARSKEGSKAASSLRVMAFPYAALLVPFEGKARVMFYSAGEGPI